MKNIKLNVIVVGAGMYTCGRGTDGYGTILPAIIQRQQTRKDIGEVIIVGRSPSGIASAKIKARSLMRIMDCRVRIKYIVDRKGDSACLKSVIRTIAKPAAAIIAIPDKLHARTAAVTITRALHTLVVKPLAPTLNEVRSLLRLQRESGVYCAVEFHKRFDEANLKLKDAIRHGAIGDPLYFLVEFSQRKSMPAVTFKKWVRETNVFQYLGIHYVDMVYFVTGAMPVRAMATGQKGWLSSRGINAYDSIQSMIEWRMPSGQRFTSSIFTNWVDPVSTSAMSDQKIKVIGTKGRFESDQKRRGVTIVTDEKGIEEPNPYFSTPYGAEGAVRYRGYGIDSICQFLDDALSVENGKIAIADLEKKRPTFRQSIVPTAVLEAVNKSLKQGGAWMEIKI